MTMVPMFPGFDGLMTLSRREGVDIRPTLLRVLTDLYVQTPAHSPDEENQFVELFTRLHDAVDDATRAAVRARLSIYPRTPAKITEQLALRHDFSADVLTVSPALQPDMIIAAPAAPLPVTKPTPVVPARALQMQPDDASELNGLFFKASSPERLEILRNLETAPLKPSARTEPRRAARAVEALERHAMTADRAAFAGELGLALILTTRVARDIVADDGGEPLAIAMKALAMPGDVFQRVLLFLNSGIGGSVNSVYRLSRLYDSLPERSALIMLSAWRGADVAMRARYKPALHDDERHRARPASSPIRAPSLAPQLPGAVSGTRSTN